VFIYTIQFTTLGLFIQKKQTTKFYNLSFEDRINVSIMHLVLKVRNCSFTGGIDGEEDVKAT